MKPLFLLSLFACVAVTGCKASYDHTDITQVGSSELPQTIGDTSAELKVGDVLTASVTPYNTDGNPMIESITSDSPDIVQVLETSTPSQFALLGMAPGTANLQLHADGEVVSILHVTVDSQ